MKELIMIQQELKAPKTQRNNFGGYNYRSCEDILEAVKPLLAEQSCTLTITDEIVMVGERIYLKATATLTNPDGKAVSGATITYGTSTYPLPPSPESRSRRREWTSRKSLVWLLRMLVSMR